MKTTYACQVQQKLTDQIAVGGMHTFINPYSYLALRRSPGAIGAIDNVLVDGQLMVTILKFLRVTNLKRVSFDMTSLAKSVFEAAQVSGQSIYFVGSTSEQIESAIENIKRVYPRLKIAGVRNGYFLGEADEDDEVLRITASGAEVVVVGMGAVKQELFLSKLKNSGWAGTGYTCGGFLHQTASGVKYYPDWMNKLNLRWLYRIYDEPKLIKRYMLEYPVSIFFMLKDFGFGK